MITLRTARLTLRPFTLDDAPAVQRLCSDREVALNTLLIPHPYPDGAAEAWISTHREDYETNRIHHFALDDGELVGAMGLVTRDQGIAEIGYWIGVPFWNRGYATEAGREVLRYGFEDCGLHRIFAGYFTRNAASGRVMEKIGMRYEGTLRRHAYKWGDTRTLPSTESCARNSPAGPDAALQLLRDEGQEEEQGEERRQPPLETVVVHFHEDIGSPDRGENVAEARKEPFRRPEGAREARIVSFLSSLPSVGMTSETLHEGVLRCDAVRWPPDPPARARPHLRARNPLAVSSIRT